MQSRDHMWFGLFRVPESVTLPSIICAHVSHEFKKFSCNNAYRNVRHCYISSRGNAT